MIAAAIVETAGRVPRGGPWVVDVGLLIRLVIVAASHQDLATTKQRRRVSTAVKSIQHAADTPALCGWVIEIRANTAYESGDSYQNLAIGQQRCCVGTTERVRRVSHAPLLRDWVVQFRGIAT